MEFEGVGTIPYTAPDEDLKPFFRRKYKTVFRLFNREFGGTTGMMGKEQVQKYVEHVGKNIPEQNRETAMKKHFAIVNLCMLFDNDSITEEQYLEEWIKVAFEDQEARKKKLMVLKPAIIDSFGSLDTNKDGVIDRQEYEKWYKVRCVDHDTTELVFKAIDANGDGVISLMEWAYAMADFWFNSGEDNANSLFFGNLVED